MIISLLSLHHHAALAADKFPPELVAFEEHAANPVFTAAGAGHWDARIRERGWILREGDSYRMWYTGYDGTREGIKLLGLATSPDGLKWTRYELHFLTCRFVVCPEIGLHMKAALRSH